jgi:hypothetical protein
VAIDLRRVGTFFYRCVGVTAEFSFVPVWVALYLIICRLQHLVEVLGHYSNLVDQGERVSYLLQLEPSGPPEAKIRTNRRVCRRLDPAQVDRLVAGYAEGVPVADLASTFGVDQWTVQKYARRHGLPRRSPRLGPNQAKEAADLYVAGSSLASVAKHFDVATDTVAKALTGGGIKLRPRRGWKY